MKTEEVMDIYTLRDYVNNTLDWRSEIGGIIKRLGFVDLFGYGDWLCEDDSKNRLYLDSSGFARIM